MKFSFRSILAIMVIAMLLVAACGATPTATPMAAATKALVAPAATKAPAAGSILLTGAGATFPYPLYSRWFYEYAFVNPAVRVNYQSIGSGGGIQQITAKTVDFGASDAILTDAQYAAVAPNKIQMYPIVAGAVVPAYNVKELVGKDPLILDGTTLANIFLGAITKWNDPAIAALNPGVTLPAKDIITVHRSDSSGTTNIFTDYLSAVSSDWKSKVGKGTAVNWPNGLGGKGNEGVSGTVSQNDGSIGYLELAYAKANKFQYSKMKNSAGSVVEATAASTQADMNDFAGQLPDSLAMSIVNGGGKDSWPIAGYTYLLMYTDQQDCVKGKAVLDLFKWGLSDAGSKFATDLDYVPLPAAINAKVLARMVQTTCQGKPMP
jgi:phosphate transport system substrate-binding protein